jgi:phage terminase small subunit
MVAQPRPLTERQARFVSEYLVDRNGTAAYRRAFPWAGYNTARTEAARLLAKPCIRDVMLADRKSHAARCEVDADRVTRELALIAFADITDLLDHCGRFLPLSELPPAIRRALATFKVRRVRTQTWTAGGGKRVIETVEVISVSLWPKLQALDKLARKLGMYGKARR